MDFLRRIDTSGSSEYCYCRRCWELYMVLETGMRWVFLTSNRCWREGYQREGVEGTAAAAAEESSLILNQQIYVNVSFLILSQATN